MSETCDFPVERYKYGAGISWPMLDQDASSAKSLTLAAIIIQAVFFVIGILLVLLLAIAFVTTTGPTGATMSIAGAGVFTLFFSVGFAISLVWILLDYFLIYKKLAEERVSEAETPCIVLGIIQLLFSGLIPGILLIIAYVKIRDSTRRYQPYPGQQPGPIPPPPPPPGN